MNIYSVLQIGDYHINHCEDYLYIGDVGNDRIICAVMDGCTMATDSYFAATLVGKLLRRIAMEKSYKELYLRDSNKATIEESLKSILQELFSQLNITKTQLILEEKEMLTTLIILLADKRTADGIAMVIGDGIVSIDGNITEFDQDNKPDYLGFHLNTHFETWYCNQSQKIIFENARDITIATDGILTFTQLHKADNNESINAIDYLTQDITNADNTEMLNLKLKSLEHTYGLKPTDDLAMIRLIFE